MRACAIHACANLRNYTQIHAHAHTRTPVTSRPSLTHQTLKFMVNILIIVSVAITIYN